MQNISVYLNERASNGTKDWKKQITNGFFRSNIMYRNPHNIEELYHMLDIDIVNKVDAILSVGGDGTVNTIIQKVAGTEIGLFVVPGGTANDFARALGSSSNIKQMTQTIRKDLKKKIDLISINGKMMATNGGLGFASEVAEEINQLRLSFPQFKKFMKWSGSNIYSLFLAKKLLNLEIKAHQFKIESAEYSNTIQSPLILVNNQTSLGGYFNVAPHTNNQDGKINITIFTHQNRLELIKCILEILVGNYPLNDKNIITFETNAIQIDLLSEEKIPFFGDGEILNKSNSWDIKCHANILTVYSPQKEKEAFSFYSQSSLV